VTEGPTLLPRHRSDKRTKEVFALSLERMNHPVSRGCAPGMDGLDGPPSEKCMVQPGDCCPSGNSACPESLFFLSGEALMLAGLSAQLAWKRKILTD